jgi:hypothetical protein
MTGTKGKPKGIIDQTSELAKLATRAAAAYDRQDLVERLERRVAQLADPDITALVVGEFKQGKSTLVNALLNAPLCPVSDDVATVVPTVFRHAEQPSAHVELPTPGDAPDASSPGAKQAIALGEIADFASERRNPRNARGVQSVQIRLPRQLLASGLALVDTPGVGGLESVHGAATTAALSLAEVVIFVTDASQELSWTEIEFLQKAIAQCPNVICVLTKIDLYPQWRVIEDLNTAHLKAAELDLEIVPVSSFIRQEALRDESKDLNLESGYPMLLEAIARSTTRGQALAANNAISDVRFVIDQIMATFESELAILDDPDQRAKIRNDLESAQARAEQLKAMSSQWQRTLSDGSTDLTNDVDHDLRRRLRAVTDDAEVGIEDNDPEQVWDEFAPWLRQRVAEEIAENYSFLRRETDELAITVAEHFAIDEQAVVHPVEITHPDAGLDDMEIALKAEQASRGGNALAAIRGSYGGILMFGMVGSLAGLAMLNPITAVVGIGLGRRALKEEKKRQLTMRRQQAKMTTRKFLDEVSFTFGKQCRDTVRSVQRELRDEFTARADELQRSVREALVNADTALKQTVGEQGQRKLDITSELKRLAAVHDRAEALSKNAATALAGQLS